MNTVEEIMPYYYECEFMVRPMGKRSLVAAFGEGFLVRVPQRVLGFPEMWTLSGKSAAASYEELRKLFLKIAPHAVGTIHTKGPEGHRMYRFTGQYRTVLATTSLDDIGTYLI